MTNTTAIQRVESEVPIFELGKVFAASGYFADAREAAQAIVKIHAGRELGIGPVASMTGIFMVKGRVTFSANTMGALIKRSRPRYDYRVLKLDDITCVIEFFQDGQVCGQSSFTMDDSRKAGLLTNSTWKGFPRNMLFSRAMSNGCKWFCPDIFTGPIYTPDELGHAVDPETGEAIIDAEPDPQPTKPVKLTVGPQVPVEQATPPAGPAPAAPLPNPESNLTELLQLIEEHGLSDQQQQQWLDYFKVKRLADLPQGTVDRIVKKVKETMAAKQAQSKGE